MKRTLTFLLAAIIFFSSFAGNLIPVNASEEKMIIALDAGHDAKHAGATVESLLEHELTLKIAYYCKAELEKYDGIEVYMTRTDSACPCPDASDHARCIEQRMLAAKNAGADYYISLHLNSQERGTTANGVEVIYPNSNWKPELGTRGKHLAQYIQKELVALGLNDRGAYCKDSSIDERNPDGSLADYYTVQIAGKKNDVASVIVEHAFMTNPTDRSNFLATEEGLQKLGIADAKAIGKMLGGYTGWDQVGEQWYYYENGISYTGWLYDRGYWYYLNSEGVMQTGWVLVNGTWYYLNDEGAMQTGWIKLDGEWYYLNPDGAMQTGWKTIDGKKYLFNSNGEIIDDAESFIIDVSHWQGNINWDKVATTEVDGVILRCGHGDELTEKDGQWNDKKYESYLAEVKRLGLPYGIYFYNTATTIEQARMQAKNAVAVIKNSGANPTLPVYVDIEQDGGKCDLVAIAKVYMEEFVSNGFKAGIYANANYWKNYLNDPSLNIYYRWIAAYGSNNGAPSPSYHPQEDFQNYMMWQYTSQYVLDGITENTVDCNVLFKWHAKQNGWNKVGNTWFYYENGYLAHGWRFLSGTWYYFSAGGAMQTGWVSDKNNWYHMDASGAMQTGWQKIDGTWYYMNASGVMQTGWQFINGTWYYFAGSGAMLTGWQFIKNEWYYMDGSGAMLTGWKKLDGTWYYMNPSGAMQTDWQFINGTWYYMDGSGAMQTGWRYIKNIWYYLNADGAMQTGWKKINGTWYYMDGSGAMLTGWQLIKGTWYYMDESGAWIK